MSRVSGLLVGLALFMTATVAHAAIVVRDDGGHVVTLKKPAQRIVSLAPHLTEILFAIGAGHLIVGTIEYSDYPEPALGIPRIGNSSGIDLERLAALRPDLILAWKSGNPARQVERIRELGYPVYVAEIGSLEDVAQALGRLGQLAGTQPSADRAVREFRMRRAALQARYAGRTPVAVFYQILDPALMTVNGKHMVSDVLRLCGGINIFSGLPLLVPRVEEEAVLAAKPEAIVAGGTAAAWQDWQARWRSHPQMRAVRSGNLFFVPADLIHRPGPRLLQGAEAVCELLDRARQRH